MVNVFRTSVEKQRLSSDLLVKTRESDFSPDQEPPCRPSRPSSGSTHRPKRPRNCTRRFSRTLSVHPVNRAGARSCPSISSWTERSSALNAGPQYQFTKSFSLYVSCDTKEETDGYWNKLIADGGAAGRCGWLKDKFGLSWQIVPRQMGQLLGGGGDPAARRPRGAGDAADEQARPAPRCSRPTTASEPACAPPGTAASRTPRRRSRPQRRADARGA